MFQTILVVGFLVVLEGLLSFDNAIVLALLVKKLPDEKQQKQALTYGIWGAFGFRFMALCLLTFLVKMIWLKALGAIYLLQLSIKHFWKVEYDKEEENEPKRYPGFWHTVLMVELMDIAFSVDSIMASVGVSNEFWVIFTGGVLGIIMMRFAATLFIKLINRFPKLEESAYYLITVIGLKMLIEVADFQAINFHDPENIGFWSYWSAMLIGLLVGFRR